MFKFTKPSPLAAVLGVIFAGLIALGAAVIFSFNPYVIAPTQSPVPSPNPVAHPTSCGEQSGTELQTCCENWATENEVVRLMCTGQWEFADDQCVWQCGSELP